MAEAKTVAYYRRLPYTRRVRVQQDSDGAAYFVAWIEELPALEIDGDTREEAFYKLNELFGDYVEMLLEHGDEVPEPGKWPPDGAGQVHQENLFVADQAKSTATVPFTAPPPWTIAKDAARLATKEIATLLEV
ncbi:MAG TPA: type II toxin-antitoxin system HicB family antitoxin [Longimicrobiaceae bacterium]|nr:type II toxin-antitoxin system HicB family antitoxin [Longimicrobiaceae bacterium]